MGKMKPVNLVKGHFKGKIGGKGGSNRSGKVKGGRVYSNA